MLRSNCNLVLPACCPLQMMVPGMGGPGMGGPGMMGPMGMPGMGPMGPGMRPPMAPGPDADPQRMMFYKTRICHACVMHLLAGLDYTLLTSAPDKHNACHHPELGGWQVAAGPLQLWRHLQVCTRRAGPQTTSRSVAQPSAWLKGLSRHVRLMLCQRTHCLSC